MVKQTSNSIHQRVLINFFLGIRSN